MRNRPDSRHRLAGLTPADPRAPGDPADGDEDEWERLPSPVPRRGPERQHSGGWVPDVDVPPSPLGRRGPAGDTEPPDERTELPEAGTAARDDGYRGPTPDPSVPHRARRVRYFPHHAWGRVAQRWVPEPLREARVDPGRRGALLLAVVAAVAALVAAVGVWRDQPEPRPVQAVSLAQVSDATAVATSPARSSGRTTLSTVAVRTTGGGASGSGSSGVSGGGSGVSGGSGGSGSGSDSGSSGGSGSGGDGTTGRTAGADVLIVSVTGAVRHPGLVQLPPGSRVADAIAKAGGVTDAADLTGVNLAARLTDGTSVVVSDPSVGGGGSSVSGSGSGSVAGTAGSTSTARTGPAGKVDLNTADAATLDALPGVGPVTAAAIVAWREKNGRYTSVEQLQEIQGIGPAKYAALAALVTV